MEILLFVALVFGFSHLAYVQLVGETPSAGTIGILVSVLLSCVSYFAIRELSQVVLLRQVELGVPTNGLRFLVTSVLSAPLRYGRCVVRCIWWSPWFFRQPKQREAYVAERRYKFGVFMERELTLFHKDPLTFLGLPKVWRRDFWNWIDVSALVCVCIFGITVCRRVYRTTESSFHDKYYGSENDGGGELSTADAHFLNLACVTVLLLSFKVLAFLKAADIKLATFIEMIQKIALDLREFVIVFFIFLMTFAQIFFLRLGAWRTYRFGFHDDGASNVFRSFEATLQAVYLLGFLGDFDLDNYPRAVDVLYLDIFIFVIIVVLLNVLIAIVSDSYADAMKAGEKIFWRSRLELVTEIALVWGVFLRSAPASWFEFESADVERLFAEELKEERKVDDAVEKVFRRLQKQQFKKADLDAGNAELHARIQKLDEKLDRLLGLLHLEERRHLGTTAGRAPLAARSETSPP